MDNWTLEVVLYMKTVTSTRYQVVREVSSSHLPSWHGGDDIGPIPSTCCTVVRGGVRTQSDNLRKVALRCKVVDIKRFLLEGLLSKLPQQSLVIRGHLNALKQLLCNLLF